MEELSLEALRERFSTFDMRHNPEKYQFHCPPGLFRKASVLIPLFYRDGDYRVILTVRSKDLTHHAGYVAFPGGMRDEEDEDEIHTALREAEEEIGLDPNLVNVICVSGPSFTHPNSLVTPVIALVQPDVKFDINEKEVSMVFDLPLSRFLGKERLRISDYIAGKGHVFHVHHFIDSVRGVEVDTWGFTAGLCVCTALVLYQSDRKFSFADGGETTKDNVFAMDVINSIIHKFTLDQAKL